MSVRARFLGLCCACLATLPLSGKAGVLDYLFPKHDVEVITVTDMTKEGSLRRQPSPENPIYYIAVNGGFRDFGGLIAGDKIPKDREVDQVMVKVLKKRGFLPATKEHRPTVLVFWTWGTMYTDMEPQFDLDLPPIQRNHGQILRFLGGYKYQLISKDPRAFDTEPIAPELMRMSSDAGLLYDLASEDMFVAAIGAYDLAALARKQRVLLWTTKISCPARGLVLADTIPTMLDIAGPNIGRETVKPVWVRATDKYKPDIKIGDPVVVPDNQLPVYDAKQIQPRKKR